MTETKESYVTRFETWAIVEIMGHHRYAGYVTEQVIAGGSFLRVDVPEFDGRPAFTKLFGTSSIYGITPVAESVARAMAQQLDQQPVTVWDLPNEIRKALKAITDQRPIASYDGFDDA